MRVRVRSRVAVACRVRLGARARVAAAWSPSKTIDPNPTKMGGGPG